MTTTETLEAILVPHQYNAGFERSTSTLRLEIEAEPEFFLSAAKDAKGMAQAIILVDEHRYAITLEELP